MSGIVGIERVSSDAVSEMEEIIGERLKQPGILNNEAIKVLAFRYYVASNDILELERIPEDMKSNSTTYLLAERKGRVGGLANALKLLGQGDFVVANEVRMQLAREEEARNRLLNER